MQTLEQPTVDVLDAGHDIENHWVPKASITRSIVHGTQVKALCGSRFIVEAQGGGSAASSQDPVCPACQAVYDDLVAL